MEKDGKYLLMFMDCMMILMVLIAISIRIGIMKNPYSQEDIQMFSLTALAGVGVFIFHRLADKN